MVLAEPFSIETRDVTFSQRVKFTRAKNKVSAKVGKDDATAVLHL